MFGAFELLTVEMPLEGAKRDGKIRLERFMPLEIMELNQV
jgi:hypothetical protein